MNQIKVVIVLFIFFTIFQLPKVVSQTLPAWYLVSFTDKNDSPFDISSPEEFLTQKAIERRKLNDIEIDSSDLPINPAYIDSLQQINISAYHKSKWLNAALVKIEISEQLSEMKSLSIVDSVMYLAPFIGSKTNKNTSKFSNASTKTKVLTSIVEMDLNEYSTTHNRIHMVGLDPILSKENSGQGIHIAVFDNGFLNVNKISAFNHLYDNQRVIGVFNFTNDGKDVYNSGSHGTAVLSTMAGKIEGEFAGSAIGASYYLFQTEDNRYEYPIEECNWLFAAELADSVGVDIITSSLVYSTFDDSNLDHNHSQLDGKTAIISKAAHFASQKGIYVFNSAGNEGNGPWQKICFPSDAAGVFTIGAVDQEMIIAPFSSTGYSVDGRVKPEFVAEGQQTPILNSSGEIRLANGTSFSTPFLAGAMAVFLQTNPLLKHDDVYNALLESASQFNSPDSIKGYGIPNFYFASILLKNNTSINEVDDGSMKILPNPFQNEFHILYNSNDSQLIDISIYDMAGKLVYEKIEIVTQRGNNLIRIEYLSELSIGAYIVNLSNGIDIYSRKIVKEK